MLDFRFGKVYAYVGRIEFEESIVGSLRLVQCLWPTQNSQKPCLGSVGAGAVRLNLGPDVENSLAPIEFAVVNVALSLQGELAGIRESIAIA